MHARPTVPTSEVLLLAELGKAMAWPGCRRQAPAGRNEETEEAADEDMTDSSDDSMGVIFCVAVPHVQ